MRLGELFFIGGIGIVGLVLFPTVAHYFGIDSFILNLNGFIPLVQMLPIVFVGFIFFGVGFIFFGVFSVFTGLDGSSDTDASVANSTTGIMASWVNSLYEQEKTKPMIRQSWNCKNCGGPNVEQIQCQYCGMVKE